VGDGGRAFGGRLDIVDGGQGRGLGCGLRFREILFGEDAAKGADAVELFKGPAVEALGLGLVTKEELPVRFAAELREAGGCPVIVILAGGDLKSVSEFGVFEDSRVAGNLQRFLQAEGDEAAFDAVGTQQGVPGESEALDGEELLGVDGLVDGDQIGFEVGDGVDLFDADGGEARGIEEMLASVGSFGWEAGLVGHAMSPVQI
jgi:hypothetical protein